MCEGRFKFSLNAVEQRNAEHDGTPYTTKRLLIGISESDDQGEKNLSDLTGGGSRDDI